MANSELYGSFISVKPIKGEIDKLRQKYGDSSEVLNHIISADGKPEYSLSYSYCKKLKNYFENANSNDTEGLEKHGGFVLKNFINNSLNNNRNQIDRKKTVKSNIGMENQFIKTHNKTFLKPTDFNNLKAPNGAARIELTEWVMKEEEEEKEPINQEIPNNQTNACISIIINPDKKILLLKRSDNDEWMPNKYALVGGKQEEGEDNYTTVLREVLEESSLVLDSLVYCYNKKENNHSVDVFVGICLDPNTIDLSNEHTDYKWVNGEEIKNMDTVPNLVSDINKALKIFVEKSEK